jgi:F420-0:gamma-glutamyl ligase-like protein
VVKYRLKLRIIRKHFQYWYPGTDVVNEIIRKYRRYIEGNDFVVLSEKALSTALGNIYDENLVKADPLTSIATFIVMKILWGKILRFVFKNYNIIKLINNVPLELAASHKKVALRYGGVKHFLKPISEAGIDTTNLPYRYVSLPLRNPLKVAEDIRKNIACKLGKSVNILIIDTDRTFKPRFLRNIAFSTRSSSIRGVIDLGAYAYFLGRIFRKYFTLYPTPVAYVGIDLGLPIILKIAKVCSKYMGSGFGRNIVEMIQALGVENFDNIRWVDMRKIYHYPALLVKVKLIKQ